MWRLASYLWTDMMLKSSLLIVLDQHQPSVIVERNLDRDMHICEKMVGEGSNCIIIVSLSKTTGIT